jgi:GntR family transcriptional regulator / MocR family aminotransferase
LICRLLINPGDAVAVEDPGCINSRKVLAFCGARAVPIAVDHHGLIVENLFNCSEWTKLVFVTPSHQVPTGAELTLPRRFDLLNWAQHSGSIVIEDDHDSEFRYGEAIPPMVHADRHGNVIYRYSFGRVLHPLLRSGFLVLPPSMVSLFHAGLQMLDLEASPFEQRALSDFINEGHYERYLKRLRTQYASRRAYVIQGLTVNFGKAVVISNSRVGRQILITLQSEHSDEHLLACARKSSFPMFSTRSNYLTSPKPGEFLIDCSAAPDDEIRRAGDIFAALVQAPGDRIESLLSTWLPPVSTPVMVELA